jgi:hypothetical protein
MGRGIFLIHNAGAQLPERSMLTRFGGREEDVTGALDH